MELKRCRVLLDLQKSGFYAMAVELSEVCSYIACVMPCGVAFVVRV